MTKRHARQPVYRDQPTADRTVMSWPPVDAELLARLPPVLRAVVRALGFGRARNFLESRGGAPIWVPTVKQSAWGLSPDEMARLREALEPHLNTSRRITLPKVDKLFLHYRNEQIVRERGMRTARDIAQTNALTVRHVLNIFRDTEGGRPSASHTDFLARQSDLFAD